MRYRNKIGITIIALLMSVVCSYAQDLEIVGMPIDCKESSSSVDYQQYGVLALGNHSYYEWTIEGGADFNPSRTATGNFVTVRFTEGTGTVILRVTERSGNMVLRTGVREISKNIRPTMISVDGPTGWGAVCLEQKGVVYTATANNAQSFTWTVPEGNTLVSQSGNTAVVDFHGVAGNMVVCAQNGEGCVSYNCLHPYVAPVGDCPQPQQCEMTVSVENKSVCQNDVFDVTLSMSEEECYCISSMLFSVRYNPSVLQLEGIVSQSNDVIYNASGDGIVNAHIITNGTGFRGGNIGTLRFKALESGTSDITPISFEYTGSGDGEEPTVTFVNGVVTVAPSTQIQISPTVSEVSKGETVALQATPTGGTWQGEGVSGTTFNSATAGVGKHTLTYIVAPNGEMCGGRDSIEITVTNDCNFRFILPDTLLCEPAGLVTIPIRLSDTCACLSAVSYRLTYDSTIVRYIDVDGGNKEVLVAEDANGLESIVLDNQHFVTTDFLEFQFEVVGQGTSDIVLFIREIYGNGNLRESVSTGRITIGQSPIVQIDVPQTFYEQDTAIALTAIPANGQWIGDGITDGNYFNPSLAGIGTHTLKYVVSASGDYCAAEDSVQIEVKSNCRWEVLSQDYNAFVGDTVQFEFGLNNPANCGCVSSLIATIQYDNEKLQYIGDTSYYSQGESIIAEEGKIFILISSLNELPLSLPFVAKAEGNAIVQAEVVDFIGNIRDVLSAQSNVQIEEKVVRTIEIAGAHVVCKSNQWEDYHWITYNIAEPNSNAQYSWTVTGNAQIGTQTANSVQIHFLSGMQTVSLTAREIVNGEQTAETTIAIEQRIRPNNLNYQYLGDNNVCNTAENVIYTVSGDASEYHWEVPANAEIVSGQGTNQIAVNFNGTSGNIVVYAQNGEGCLSYGGVYFPVNLNGDCPPQEYSLKSLTLSDEEQDGNEGTSLDVAETYLNVYPLPVKHILTISTNATIQRVIVYDVVGGIVMQRQNVTQIDVSNLLAGNYFVQIETDKGTFTKPIVVVK